ncbi:MAG: hypothetical protein KGS73_08275 [Chloroflexi bacterium]|nr:hypothetical protein [Chloroflexota bacterium]
MVDPSCSAPTPRLTRRQAFSQLRAILVGLFVEPDSIRMVADDAELDSAQIDFRGAPVQVWTAVLTQAAREGKVGQVAAVAAGHYDEQRQPLLDAALAYEKAPRDPVDWLRWLLAAAGAVVLLLLAVYGWLAMPPEPLVPMSAFGTFNLALAEFPVVGNSPKTCVAERVNQLLEETLRQPAGVAQERIISDFRGPATIGVVDEKTVPQLAEQLGATVVVYGVMTASASRYTVQPAFYVPGTVRGFEYGGELAGPNQLGLPIEFELPPQLDCDTLTNEDLGQIDRVLGARLAVLGQTIAGLGFYFQEEYEDAAYHFGRSARQNEEEQDAAGLAVAEMLLGAARVRQALPADPERAVRLAEAEQAFRAAVEHNPEYSRAYLGLGIVALEQAKIYDQPGVNLLGISPDGLGKATQAFTLALAAADQPPAAWVPAKAALGIGIAHWLGGSANLPGWSVAEAEAHLKRVTEMLAANQAAGLKAVAALAYGYLGQLAQLRSDWGAMRHNCQQTVNLLEQAGVQQDVRTAAEAWGCVAAADKELGDFCAAAEGYGAALANGSRQRAGTSVVPAAKLERWRASQEEMGRFCVGEEEQP